MLYSSYRSLFKKAISVMFTLLPMLACAEVSDKVPSSLYIWTVGGASAVACFLGASYQRGLLVIIAPFPALWFISLFLEIHSSDVGTTLYQEQGLPYYIQAYLSFALSVFGAGAGWLLNRWRSPHRMQ
jgi:purine-cytosine permease-like protein